jgi:hypothetical protein
VNEPTTAVTERLSTLSRLLRISEGSAKVRLTEALADARSCVTESVRRYDLGRLAFGQALSAYRQALQDEAVWNSAAKLIGSALNIDSETILQYAEKYEGTAYIDRIKRARVKASEGAGTQAIDSSPSLLPAPSPEVGPAPDFGAVVEQISRKREKRGQPRPGPNEIGSERFAMRILREFDRFKWSPDRERKEEEMKLVLEYLICRLRLFPSRLHWYSSTDRIPRPASKRAA